MKPIIGVTPDFNAGDRKEWGGREPTTFYAHATFVPSRNSAASRWSFHSSQTGLQDGASCGAHVADARVADHVLQVGLRQRRDGPVERTDHAERHQHGHPELRSFGKELMPNRRMPNAPSFISTPACSIETPVGAATWPSGDHVWNGHIPPNIPKPITKNGNKGFLEVGVLRRHRPERANRTSRCRLDEHREDADEDQHAPRHQ